MAMKDGSPISSGITTHPTARIPLRSPAEPTPAGFPSFAADFSDHFPGGRVVRQTAGELQGGRGAGQVADLVAAWSGSGSAVRRLMEGHLLNLGR